MVDRLRDRTLQLPHAPTDVINVQAYVNAGPSGAGEIVTVSTGSDAVVSFTYPRNVFYLSYGVSMLFPDG